MARDWCYQADFEVDTNWTNTSLIATRGTMWALVSKITGNLNSPHFGYEYIQTQESEEIRLSSEYGHPHDHKLPEVELRGKWYYDTIFEYFQDNISFNGVGGNVVIGRLVKGAFFYFTKIYGPYSTLVHGHYPFLFLAQNRYKRPGWDTVEEIYDWPFPTSCINNNPWEVNPSFTPFLIGKSVSEVRARLLEIPETSWKSPVFYDESEDMLYYAYSWWAGVWDPARIIFCAWQKGFREYITDYDEISSWGFVVAGVTKNGFFFRGPLNCEQYSGFTDQADFPDGYVVASPKTKSPAIPWLKNEVSSYQSEQPHGAKIFLTGLNTLRGHVSNEDYEYLTLPIMAGDPDGNVETGGVIGMWEYPYDMDYTSNRISIKDFMTGEYVTCRVFPYGSFEIQNEEDEANLSGNELNWSKKIAIQIWSDSFSKHLPLHNQIVGQTATNLSDEEIVSVAKKSFWHVLKPAASTSPEKQIVLTQSTIFGVTTNNLWGDLTYVETYPILKTQLLPRVWGICVWW
ncbi:MAG: hypothetical protein ACTSWW_10940 [Promethearchaeota archaeon]